jgi:hypothetical protein
MRAPSKDIYLSPLPEQSRGDVAIAGFAGDVLRNRLEI